MEKSICCTQSQDPGCVDVEAGAGTCVAACASVLGARRDVQQESPESPKEQPGNLAM